ncbi:hypothetical protein J2X77_004012 [Sphingobacterium sp. 2149]|nr:hypothetical protein [Sphingobacterium sp. 2149]
MITFNRYNVKGKDMTYLFKTDDVTFHNEKMNSAPVHAQIQCK